jgi:hypothetical protein
VGVSEEMVKEEERRLKKFLRKIKLRRKKEQAETPK